MFAGFGQKRITTPEGVEIDLVAAGAGQPVYKTTASRWWKGCQVGGPPPAAVAAPRLYVMLDEETRAAALD